MPFTTEHRHQIRYDGQHCKECTDAHFAALVAADRSEEAGRKNRKYAELLQEIRIAQGGSQLVLAYLMSLAFTNRFPQVGHLERAFYLVALMLAVAATALLVAPTFIRNFTFRHRSEAEIADHAARCVQLGMAMLMLSIIGAVLFTLYAVFRLSFALTLAVATLVWFVAWWYLIPLWVRSGRFDGRGADGARVGRSGKGRRRR
jgi:hypothetical protein